MVQLFSEITAKIITAVTRDVMQGKNLDMLLGAFNEWQEDEQDGASYIFNINDKGNLKHLVDNDILAATDIAWVIQNCKNGLFVIGEDGTPVPIDDKRLRDWLINNAEDYIPYVIMYAARCGKDSAYAQVYEEYITQILECSEFDPKH